jgi:hypothetical protein
MGRVVRLPEEEYKSIMLEGLALVKDRKLQYWITDARNLELLSENVNLWTITEALPIGVQNGVRRIGFVMPQEFFAQFSVEEVAENMKEQFQKLNISMPICYFSALEEAMQWGG